MSSSSVVRIVKLDANTEVQMFVDYAHHEVHAGSHYYIKNWYDIAGSGTVKEFILTTPDSTKEVHLLTAFNTEAEFTLSAFEGVTTSDDGDAITPINNNRNSSKTSVLSTFEDPTVTNDGDAIWTIKMGSGGNKSTGERRGDAEIILKQNTKYLFRITKNATGTDWVDINLKWYEHTPKNPL